MSWPGPTANLSSCSAPTSHPVSPSASDLLFSYLLLGSSSEAAGPIYMVVLLNFKFLQLGLLTSGRKWIGFEDSFLPHRSCSLRPAPPPRWPTSPMLGFGASCTMPSHSWRAASDLAAWVGPRPAHPPGRPPAKTPVPWPRTCVDRGVSAGSGSSYSRRDVVKTPERRSEGVDEKVSILSFSPKDGMCEARVR